MGKKTETCGRCSMTTVVDVSDGDGSSAFGSERIEVSDDEARAVSPGAWLSGVKRRLDDVATRLTYGR
ncbi:hypothetical protein EGH21_02390 [Halomicroarcula sp. F13]|uniref:Uncharacterized protein n=1 Tax=Haloarcula rubra TaxID=2487747 RepID=A0AAW4PLG5_9EURY|nr:hypothetical protein [Halomicroarcula rubra]MBX0321873.1 hypothetical protein [Halomicroarcula rubra]